MMHGLPWWKVRAPAHEPMRVHVDEGECNVPTLKTRMFYDDELHAVPTTLHGSLVIMGTLASFPAGLRAIFAPRSYVVGRCCREMDFNRLADRLRQWQGHDTVLVEPSHYAIKDNPCMCTRCNVSLINHHEPNARLWELNMAGDLWIPIA